MNSITKFMPSKLAETIDNYVMNGTFKGKIITNKGDIFHALSEILGCDSDTVRKWCYPNSNGPKDPTWVNRLEEELRVSLRMNDSEFELKKITKNNYTDFAKKSIIRGYRLMKEHITSPNVDSEKYLVKFWLKFEKLKVSMPSSIYKKMELFARENFDAIVYNPDNIFPDNELNTYFKKIIEIEAKLDKFAEEELNPIIVHKS